MPLIEIAAKGSLYPTDHNFLYNNASWLCKRAQMLPGRFVENAAELLLDPGTTETAVQVTLTEINPFSVNAPDIWVKVTFTEQHDEESCHQVTSKVIHILVNLFGRGAHSLAVDVFFGPSYGCIIGQNGHEIHRW